MRAVITRRSPAQYAPDVEIVERKGLGHPDTICDALAERYSIELSRYYVAQFGAVLHHNVDKALLRGGSARCDFGGGEVIEPIEVYLAGRAATQVDGVVVPVEDIAVESAREWLREHFHALDPVRHVRIHCLVRPGSADLSSLFVRRDGGDVPLANDTSFGVGFAPESALERFVLGLDREVCSTDFIGEHPAHGEDVKIMAVQHHQELTVTVARAFVATHVPSLDAYLGEKELLRERVVRRVGSVCSKAEVHVNAADAADGSAVYLTVTGTSAESGDDGEVGRGNRQNGLITPSRPMSLEALCGKNPISHVGKLYNVAAKKIAEDVVACLEAVRSAECYLVSRIGAPIDRPEIVHVRLGVERDASVFAREVQEVVDRELAELPQLWQLLVSASAAPLY